MPAADPRKSREKPEANPAVAPAPSLAVLAHDNERRVTKSLPFVRHQHPAQSVVFLRDFVKCHHDGFTVRPCFFHHGVSNALRQLALLIGGASGQHCDLD